MDFEVRPQNWTAGRIPALFVSHGAPTLAIEENAQFEGRSRRQENPTEAPSSIEEEAPKLQPQAESTEA